MTITEVENNTKHAVEPNKASGSSPPLTADGTPLVSLNVYELKEDFLVARGPRSKKPPKILARKGSRFMFIEGTGMMFSRLLHVGGGQNSGSVYGAWGRDEPAHPIVSVLSAAKDDASSLLLRARVRGDMPSPSDILEQLIHDGRVSYDDLVSSALLVSDHDEALYEDSRLDDTREDRELADAAAQDAHENNFESRRGMYRLDNTNLICLYDNNPWQGAPVLRDEMLATLRRDLDEQCLSVAAEGSFPKDGPQANYTRVILVRDPFGQMERIREIFQKAASDAGVAPPSASVA